ncbi:MAG: HD domain-containing protein [SAR324 cluster bacterium]|nr:HD domain-containing protein [SAR324 cluster bacterium]
MKSRTCPVLETAFQTPRLEGERSPLLNEHWSYIKQSDISKFSREDWKLLNQQRIPFLAKEKSKQALEMLTVQKDTPSFGYQINNYEHCLQTATLALEDGQDEETVVVALFHDVGFVTNNETHGEFAAEMLRPYISEKNYWMLQRHMYFQLYYLKSLEGVDHNIREKWRGHDFFDWTSEFVFKYDVPSVNAEKRNVPLEEFQPMVERLFARPPKSFAPLD